MFPRAEIRNLSALPSALHDRGDRTVVLGFTLFCVALFGLLIVLIFPHAVPWLLAGAALRLGVCVVRTLRARRDVGPRPELLPEAGIPTVALVLALYPSFLVLEGLNVDLVALGHERLALGLLTLHLSVASGLAWLGVRRIRRATGEMRAFVASDRDQLKARVRQING